MARAMSVYTQNGTDYIINDPNNADEFVTSRAWNAGEPCYHGGDLYVFTADHPINTAWSGTDVRKIKLGEEVSGLKSALDALYDDRKLLYKGYVSGTKNKGVDVSIKAGEINFKCESITSSDTDSTKCQVLFYSTTLGTGVATLLLDRGVAIDENVVLDNDCDRIYFYASDTNIHSDYDTFAYAGVYITKKIIDDTLTVAGDAADAKAAGDAIRTIESGLIGYVMEIDYTQYPDSLYYINTQRIKTYYGSGYSVKKYVVSPEKTYYLTSTITADSGFPLISYIDGNDELISYEFNPQSSQGSQGTVTANRIKLNIPQNTAYFYVNSQTEQVGYIEFSKSKFDILEEEINQSSSSGEPSEVNAGKSFELNITPIHGQSLSLAIVHAAPPIHTSPVSGGFMMDNGVYQVDNTVANMTGIAMLKEGSDTYYASGHPSAQQVENSAWGTSERINQMCGIAELQHAQQFYSICGQDGGGIETQFDTELTVMQRIFNAVKSLVPYKKKGVPLIYWIQGEHDNSVQTGVEAYKSALIAGIENIGQMAKTTFGQINPVKCVTYQTAWTNEMDRDHYTASQAQMELCRDNEMFAPSCPAYVLIKGPNDYIHISNWGEYLLGLYQGIQFYNWIVLGHKNIGVMPLNNGITYNSNKITIQFGVECAPLQFVTDWVSERTNYGFEVIRNGSNILTGVEISGVDKVVLTCSSNIASGDTVYYGMQAVKYGNHLAGSGGNLCDSQGNEMTAVIDGTTVALHNYCYAFCATI